VPLVLSWITACLVLLIQLSDHLRWKRDRHGDDHGSLPLFNGLGLLVVNEGFTFDTLKLMDAAPEVRVAAHSRAAIRPIRERVEHAWLLPGMGIGIQDGGDRALSRVGLAVSSSQAVLLFPKIPWQRPEGIGMS